MTEDRAMTIFHRLRAKYDWAGTVFIREDVETVYREKMDDPDAELPDPIWERVRGTRVWRKGITEAMLDAGWLTLEMALDEALDGVSNGSNED